MENELKNKYEDVVKAIENAEAEINSMVRQKQTLNSSFKELIIAQSKLESAEKLILEILNRIDKYKIMKKDINIQLQIAKQNRFQRKQYDLDKMYERKDTKCQSAGQMMR